MNLKQIKSMKRMAGLTLLETLFAIALGVLVILGIIVFFSSGKQSASAGKIVTDLNAIVAGFENYTASGQALLSSDSGCATDGTGAVASCDYAKVSAAGYLPTKLSNPSGQSYNVTAGLDSTTHRSALTIKITGVTTGDPLCTTISTMIPSTTGSIVGQSAIGGKINSGGGTCTATMFL